VTHKALVLTKQADEYRRLIEEARLPRLTLAAASDAAEGVAVAGDSDILVGDPDRVVAALPHLPRLSWVQLTWAGVERMLDPGLRHDYVLTNVRGVFGPLMSEYVFAYLLLHERRIIPRYDAQRQGRWETMLPGTLQGKTIGLAGVGSIGAHLAATAKHFGMTVRGYTRESEGCEHVDAYFHGRDTSAFAAGLDYLVAVLPHTPGTRRLVDQEMLGALPAHGVFVNAGRGDTVDTAALIQALQEKRLAAAMLDVFEEEPLPAHHPLWQTPGVFISCHTAAPSFPRDIVGVFVENYRRYARGEPLRHQVDFERGY
jgi:phosphoglycerate dehydrogenase-like enzyme